MCLSEGPTIIIISSRLVTIGELENVNDESNRSSNFFVVNKWISYSLFIYTLTFFIIQALTVIGIFISSKISLILSGLILAHLSQNPVPFNMLSSN